MQVGIPDGVLLEKAQNTLFDFLIENYSSCNDNSTLFEYYGKVYSLNVFRSDVMHLAGSLIDLGITEGDTVLICLITTPESIALLYACNLIGAVPVMADVRLSVSELYSLICETKVKLAFISDFHISNPRLLTSPPTLKHLIISSPCDALPKIVQLTRNLSLSATGKPYILFRSSKSKICRWSDLFRRKPYSSANIRRSQQVNGGELLFTTSGTSGSRKYVRISALSLNLAAYRYCLFMDISQINTVLSVMPIFTCYGFLNSVHAPLLFSKKLILYPIYRFRSFPRILLKTRASASFGVLGQWEALLHDRMCRKADLSFLKYASWGGDGSSDEWVKKMNRFLSEHKCEAKIMQGYGMTETVSTATLQTINDYVIGSSGKALPYTQVCIVEDNGHRLLPAGELGEICIHSICQADGYYHDSLGSSQLIREHSDGKLWIHSGDLGYMDQEGHLFVIGRKKRMFVLENGTKVFLQNLEALICKDEEIANCAAITVTDSLRQNTKRIVLFIVPKAGISINRLKKRISASVRNSLPDYLHPDRIVFARRIPKNSLGKTDYPELTAIWEAHDSEISNMNA